MISALGSNSVSLIPTKPNQPSGKFSVESLSVPQSAPKDSTSVTLTAPQTITDLRAKFNVTNISNKEVAALSLNLKNNGLISAFEAANLSIPIVPIGGTFDPDARVNLVKQVQNQLEFSRQSGSAAQTQSLTDVLSVLRDLQRG
jgi:hypothetical protein